MKKPNLLHLSISLNLLLGGVIGLAVSWVTVRDAEALAASAPRTASTHLAGVSSPALRQTDLTGTGKRASDLPSAQNITRPPTGSSFASSPISIPPGHSSRQTPVSGANTVSLGGAPVVGPANVSAPIQNQVSVPSPTGSTATSLRTQPPSGAVIQPASATESSNTSYGTAEAAQPGSSVSDLNPEAKGNYMDSNGYRVAVDSVETLPDGQTDLTLVLTPIDTPVSNPTTRRKAGLTEEQLDFRQRWGVQMYKDAQYAARAEANGN